MQKAKAGMTQQQKEGGKEAQLLYRKIKTDVMIESKNERDDSKMKKKEHR